MHAALTGCQCDAGRQRLLQLCTAAATAAAAAAAGCAAAAAAERAQPPAAISASREAADLLQVQRAPRRILSCVA
jgi:hypothetical protein